MRRFVASLATAVGTAVGIAATFAGCGDREPKPSEVRRAVEALPPPHTITVEVNLHGGSPPEDEDLDQVLPVKMSLRPGGSADGAEFWVLTGDPIVPYNGPPSAPDTFARWAMLDQCTGTPSESVSAGATVTAIGSVPSIWLIHSTRTGWPRSASIVGPGMPPP